MEKPFVLPCARFLFNAASKEQKELPTRSSTPKRNSRVTNGPLHSQLFLPQEEGPHFLSL